MKQLISPIASLIIFLSSNLFSQNTTFEYLLSSPLDEYFTDIVETPEGDIYFSGRLSTIAQPDYTYGFLAKLDMYGNFVDSNIVFSPEKSLYIDNIFQNNDSLFTIAGNIFDAWGTFNDAGIVFYRMDKFLNLFDQTEFDFPSPYKCGNISAHQRPNGNILIGGALRANINSPRPFIYEFNSVFDSLKAKIWYNDIGVILKLKELEGNNYWILNALNYRYKILDSTFTIISEQHIPNQLNGNYGLKWDTDTSFYLLGADGSGGNIAFIRQFHPIDTTGHLFNQWRLSDTIDFPALWNGLDFQNKDSIFFGGTRNIWLGNYNPWPSWFVVLQTDSMLNIRWERFYGGDAYYMMDKVVATHDGGCLVAGTRYDYLNTTEQETDIIILKLNSEGLILGNPENPGIKMHEAIVYPNPGNEEIKVRIAVQHKQSLIELFDLNGRLVLKENFTGTEGSINTTFLPSGTYIYKITSENGLNESGKWVKQ